MIEISHRISRPDVLLGIVRMENVSVGAYASDFDERLQHLTAKYNSPLDEAGERRRTASRDMLRNGRYKPTGRGKPASEYLLRAATEDSSFPRINAPVDACNYVSLKYLVPISLWDQDLAGVSRYVFRLGRAGESYVFNTAGQIIEVEDLLVGCRLAAEDDETGEPIVTPVKDSLATKTTPATKRIAACVYVPLAGFTVGEAAAICDEFACMITSEGHSSAVVHPGDTVFV
jgi:DNA/RNA-binding domain of Phe-tRNA-synthetase-like protein